MRLINSLLTSFLTLATSLCLVYALLGAGLVVCTTPQATSLIGNTFSGWEHAVFPEEDMATLAEATRSFSIEGTSEEELYDAIYGVLTKNNAELLAALGLGANNTETGANNGEVNADNAEANSTEANSDTTQHALRTDEVSASFDQYTLPANALSHLEDCTPLFQTGRISTGVVAGFGLAGLIALGLLRGRRRVGGTCIAAASVVFALLIILGAWAFFSFDSLFTWMHTMLFTQGNWTFPADSLLIQLFPEAFWAAMAGLWVLTSALGALALLIIGKLFAHR